MRLPLLILAHFILAASAIAQTCTTDWAAPVDGDWNTPSNWTNGVPDADDVACITTAGTYTVDLASLTTSISGFVLGGSSGTQSLVSGFSSFVSLTVTEDARIAPNGRMEIHNGSNSNNDGLYVAGTLLVEGEIIAVRPSRFFHTGGVLEIAPGGLFRHDANRLTSSIGDEAATFRVRGVLEGVCGTNVCIINARLDAQGGTIRVLSGDLDLRGIGTINDLFIEVAEGADLNFRNTPGVSPDFVVEGTISGTPEGNVFWSQVEVAAGPTNATLAVGGTGIQLVGVGGSFLMSAGGEFLNTGILYRAPSTSNSSGFRAVIVRNEGLIPIPTSLSLEDGAVLWNEPDGVIEINDGGSIGGSGRLENAGLIVRNGETGNFSFAENMLRSLPGSEIRVETDRLNLKSPASQTLPAGVRLTGTGRVGIPSNLEIEGIVSPGTDAQPLATLELASYFYPSPVAGNPQLIIDVDNGGQSDLLDVLFAAGTGERTRLDGTLIVRIAPGYVPQIDNEFMILRGAGTIAGQFDQIIADGAPEGIAFVTEIVEFDTNSEALMLRAVETAPDGPITVSTTAPVGGAERSIFLSGPGAPSVTAARLDCTSCLDPTEWGSILGEIVEIGSIRELRFDLTSPRAFGFYDLILQRPGLPDEIVAVTVRPYLAYALSERGLVRGARVRPDGENYNYSDLNMELRTNDDAPAFHLPSVARTTPLYDLALSSGNAFATNHFVFYESDFADDPSRAPIVLGRLEEENHTRLSFGLRIAPEDVLFPEQEPDGPDDHRIPWGDPSQFVATFGPIHLSTARMATLLVEALRTSGNAMLSDYIDAVDAADAEAVSIAVVNTLQLHSHPYYASLEDVLAVIIDELDVTVSAPPGLTEAAGLDFEMAVETITVAYAIDLEHANIEAVEMAPPDVGDLLMDEIDALFPEGIPGSGEAVNGASRVTDAASRGHIFTVKCKFDDNASGVSSILDSMEGNDAGQGGLGGGGGGLGCPQPPEGSADPNDKTTSPSYTCEIGTVIVGGEEETRCVRYYVPMSQATDPLVYSVRFENLPEATANAEFVTITDELDPNLDPSSLEVFATSSDSTFSYDVSGNTVTFRFVGIDLPPNQNPPEGEGFVSFGVRPDAGLDPGTEIRNDASIVFDFNPEIVTPEVVHELREVSDLAVLVTAPEEVNTGAPFAFSTTAANLRGDPASETVLTITPPPGATVVSVTPSAGECEGVAPIVCELGEMDQGETVEVEVVVESSTPGDVTVGGAVTSSAFDGFARNDTDAASVTIVVVGNEEQGEFPQGVTLAQPYPNPTRGEATFRWSLPSAGHVTIKVYDLLGREVVRLADNQATEPGWHEMRWTASLASGVYIAQLRAESGQEAVTRTKRFMVIR